MKKGWHPDYSVGHPLLDEQHKEFFSLCRHAEACSKDHSRDGVERYHDLLNELVKYAQRHFLTEEKMLEHCAYPDLDDHKAEHETYREKLTDFVLEATFGKLDREGLFNYLSEWWLAHILQSDMKYRRYVSTLPAA